METNLFFHFMKKNWMFNIFCFVAFSLILNVLLFININFYRIIISYINFDKNV